MFTLNEIVIRSFAYIDKKYVEKKTINTKYNIRNLSKISEECISHEEQSVKVTHAIVYLIDQNRFWYYKIIEDEVVEKHHTKNNYENSVKIIDNMLERFEKLDRLIVDYYDIKDKSKKEHITIKELSFIELENDIKQNRLKGMLLG